MPYCDSPRFRDFICDRGCIVRIMHLQDEFGPCVGDRIDPHHEPFVSQGGDDVDIIGGLCAAHHSMRHAEHPTLTAFITTHAEELKREALAAYLLYIESVNGRAPAPKRKERKPAKGKNIQPTTKTCNSYRNG